MEKVVITRSFDYKGRQLPDIGPEYSLQEVIDHYSALIPELACGFVKKQELIDSVLKIEVESNFSGKS